MPDTSLRLRRAWFTDALDPTLHPVVCGTQRSQERSDAQDGQIRQFDTGRRQASTTLTGLTTIPLTLVGLSYEDWLVVLDWIRNGTLLLFRSAQGERHYVSLFEASTAAHLKTSMNDGRAFHVTVSLYPVDYDESV